MVEMTKNETDICPNCGAPSYAGHAPGCSSVADKENVSAPGVSKTIIGQLEQDQETTLAEQNAFDSEKFNSTSLEIRKICAYLKYTQEDNAYSRDEAMKLYTDPEAYHNAKIDIEENKELIKQGFATDTEKNYSLVLEMIKSNDIEIASVGCDILFSQLDKISGGYKERAMILLIENNMLMADERNQVITMARDHIVKALEAKEERGTLNTNLLSALVLKTNDQNYEDFAGVLIENWGERNNGTVEEILASTFTKRLGHGKENALKLLEQKFGYSELEFKNLVRAWGLSNGENQQYGIKLNLLAMNSLENQNTGVCKVLMDEFGVKDFARVPEEILLAQVRERDDTSKPYGIIMLPESDHNGVLYKDFRKYKKLFDQLNGEYSIRVVEAGSKMDIARRLINLDNKYNVNNEGQKISFAIIGGHGTENSIWFGDGKGDESALRIKDLAGEGVRRAHKFFKPGANIVLFSCSTGARKGIGQELSVMLEARLVAPKTENRPESLTVEKDASGKLIFNVDYVFGGEDETSIYESGQAVR